MGPDWSYLLGFLFPEQYTKARDRILDGFWIWLVPLLLLCFVGLAVWLVLANH